MSSLANEPAVSCVLLAHRLGQISSEQDGTRKCIRRRAVRRRKHINVRLQMLQAFRASRR